MKLKDRWNEMSGYEKRRVIVLIYGLLASVSAIIFFPYFGDLRSSDKTWLYLFGSAIVALNIQALLDRKRK